MADIQSILDPLAISKGAKADAWDAFHATGTPEEFRAKLDKLDIPKETKAALWDARNGGSSADAKRSDNPQLGSSPLSKLGSAFWEGIGGKAVMDIMGARSGDPEQTQKAKDAVKGLVHGIVNEPSRAQHEGAEFYKSLVLGDKPGNLAYHLAGAVPGVGAGVQQVAHDFENKDYATGFGHALALLLPFAAHGSGAAAAIADKGPAAIEAAGAVVKDAAPVARAAVKAAAPDVGMGLVKVAGGAALSELPLPGPVKYVAGAAPVYSGVRRMGRGVRAGWEAGKAAIAERVAAAAEQLRTPEPPPQLTSTALRSSGPIAPGPVPIGLGMPQPEAAPIPLRSAAAVTPGEAFARSQGIDWASMSPIDKATKATLENVARAHANVQAQPAAAPPPNPAPPPVIPQAPPEVPQPAPQPIQAAPPVQAAPEPPTAPVEQPTPSVAQQLRDSLMPESKAAPGEVATIAPTEPEFQAATYDASARAAKTQKLAQALHDNGISFEDARTMDMAHWKMLSEATGQRVPSATSIEHTLFELKKLEKAAKPATPARAEQSAVTVPGPNGTSNGKVSITDASRALAEEMQRSGTLEAPRLKTARRAKR